MEKKNCAIKIFIDSFNKKNYIIFWKIGKKTKFIKKLEFYKKFLEFVYIF